MGLDLVPWSSCFVKRGNFSTEHFHGRQSACARSSDSTFLLSTCYIPGTELDSGAQLGQIALHAAKNRGVLNAARRLSHFFFTHFITISLHYYLTIVTVLQTPMTEFLGDYTFNPFSKHIYPHPPPQCRQHLVNLTMVWPDLLLSVICMHSVTIIHGLQGFGLSRRRRTSPQDAQSRVGKVETFPGAWVVVFRKERSRRAPQRRKCASHWFTYTQPD